jgi:predicted dehydrogenase
VSYVAADPEEILGDDSVDAVVVSTQHNSHASLVIRALQRGKAVFVEKPLVIGDSELREVEAALRDSAGRLVVDFNRSLAPATREVVDCFASRIEPIWIGCRVNAGYLEPEHWLRDHETGGGRLVGEGCHFVDLCSTIVGQPLESVQVVPLGSGGRTLPGDNFVLTLLYADGSIGTISYIATGHSRLRKERVEVLGADRSAVIDDFRRTEVYAGGGRISSRRRRSGQDKGHGAMLTAALRFFREGGEPPVPYERLIETTRATLVGRRALFEGRAEPVPIQR